MQISARAINRNPAWAKPAVLVVCVLAGAGLIYYGSLYLPMAVDWHYFFRPAALKIIQGRSPYEIESFINPPWALIPLIPFALLPEKVGQASLALVVMVVMLLAGHRMGGRRWALGALLVSPPVIALIHYGNIDWLVVLGLVLPPEIGLLLVVVKPQVGLLVGLVWLVESWLQGGWRKTLRLVSPLLVVTLISFTFYGFWPARFIRYQQFESATFMNFSLWPYSIPAGLLLLVVALRFRKSEWALLASPCLSPYVLMHSWVGALLGMIRYERVFVFLVVGLWAFLITNLFR